MILIRWVDGYVMMRYTSLQLGKVGFKHAVLGIHLIN